MGKLQFSFACSEVDRMHALMTGAVQPEGMDFNFIPLEVEEIYWRQLRHHEWDASEMSLSSYLVARSRGDDRLMGIPVFPSRMFRHSFIFINAHKGINQPTDLIGKTIGLPEYQMTANVWIRGILEHEYGVHPSQVRWRFGGEETPGREEKLKLTLPPNIDYGPIPRDKTLSTMLDTGEIDAMIAARIPSCLTKGSPNVKRLFENHPEVEAQYYEKTSIFPIMHIVAIRRDVYEQHRWVAKSLYKACLASKQLALQKLNPSANWPSLPVALPWLFEDSQRIQKTMGNDWWPYGIEKNRATLEAILQYSFEQGLSERKLSVEELFAPETLDDFII